MAHPEGFGTETRVPGIPRDRGKWSGLSSHDSLRKPKEGQGLISVGGALTPCTGWHGAGTGLRQCPPSLASPASLNHLLPCSSLDLGVLEDGSVKNKARQ